MSEIRTGVDNKKRFSLKYPDGTIKSFGTCDPREDERMDVITIGKKSYLAKYDYADTNYIENPVSMTELPKGTMFCNGYYEHERDEWVEL